MYMGAYILKYKCCHYYVGIWEHTYSFPIFFSILQEIGSKICYAKQEKFDAKIAP